MEQRKLLPRPEPLAGSAAGPSHNPVTLTGLTPKRKKAGGRFACDQCRTRKSACDGQKPTCSTCRAKRAECTYKEREKTRSDTALKVLSLLRTLGHDEAFELLQRLRDTPEVDTDRLLSPATATGPSLAGSSRGRTPESSSGSPMTKKRQHLAVNATGLQLELFVRYPIAFPSLDQLDAEAFDLGKFPDTLSRGPSPDPQRQTGGGKKYCDARISQVDFHVWTDVSVDERMAGGAMSYYLETDHCVHGLFDADLFMQDLASGDQSFCSPMLVNAVLAWACQTYSLIEPGASEYKNLFFSEARRRWDQESHRNTLTAVATAHLLCKTASCKGQDDVAGYFMREAIDMGRRMGLYGAIEEDSAKTWLDNHHDWIRAASHTAWGGYCAITYNALQTHQPMIEKPPLLPIPGELGAVLGRSKEDRYDSYPVARAGRIFHKLCKLFQIAHPVLWEYYDGEGVAKDTPFTRADPTFAEEVLRQLLAWSSELPLELVRAEGNPQHTVILHTYLHCIILDTLCPFKDRSDALPLTTFEAGHDRDAIQTVYRASVDQLKRLVLYYLSHFDVASHSFLWQPALLQGLNALIREVRLSPEQTQTPEWELCFRACMLGLSKLLPFFPVMDKFLRGILSMAVRDGVMAAPEAIKTIKDMRRKAGLEGRQELEELDAIENRDWSFIVDLDLSTKDVAAATAEALVTEFDRLSMLATVAEMLVRDGHGRGDGTNGVVVDGN